MFVDNEKEKQRMDICLSCEHYGEKWKIKGLCLKCHCLVHLKVKLTTSNCPLSKW